MKHKDSSSMDNVDTEKKTSIEKETNNIEQSAEVKNTKEPCVNNQFIRKYWQFFYYAFLFGFSFLCLHYLEPQAVILGDFGSITSVLLSLLGFLGMKWVLILSAAGFLLTVFKKTFVEYNKIYVVFTGGLTVVSFILLLLFQIG